MKHTRGLLRAAIRNRPRLRAALLPYWTCLMHLRWQFRNIVTLQSAVDYAAGSFTAKLYPAGQIPEVLWGSDFEENERDFVTSYLRPGMRVINVGANVGLYTVLASLLVGDSGRVYAFEPSSLTFERLLRNLKLNECKNVVAARIALSNVTETLVLRVDPRHPSLDGHRFVEKADGIPHLLLTDELVECRVMDDYLAEAGETASDLIIIDVEGAEFSVLKGAVNVLTQNDTTLILECSKNQVETEALLRGMGYTFWSWDKVTQSLVHANFRAQANKGNVIARRGVWSKQV